MLVNSRLAFLMATWSAMVMVGCGDDAGLVPDAPIGSVPVAVADSVTTAEDTPLPIPATDLLANDSDPDGGALTVTAVANATNGTVGLVDTTVTFVPAADFHGSATFDYTISNGTMTATATVTVTVTAVNDAPVASNDTAMVLVDNPIEITHAMLLANDVDVDGDTLTITAVSGATNGTVVEGATSVTFTPTASFVGNATFEYTVSDGTLTDTALVTITVTALPNLTCPANDGYEPNETKSAAAVIALDTTIGGIVCGEADVDFYAFPAGAGCLIQVDLAFQHATGDLDLYLHTAAEEVASSESSTDNERIIYRNGAAGTLYAEVYPYEDASIPYTLRVTESDCIDCTDDGNEPDNDATTANTLAAEATTSGEICFGDVDWFAIEVDSGCQIQAELTFLHADGDLDLLLRNASETLVASGTSTTDDETLVYNHLGGDGATYYLIVAGYQSASAPYTISYSCGVVPPPPVIGDSCEDVDVPGVIDCVLGCSPTTWVGDGLCDDGAFGADFDCAYFNNDEGDCL